MSCFEHGIANGTNQKIPKAIHSSNIYIISPDRFPMIYYYLYCDLYLIIQSSIHTEH